MQFGMPTLIENRNLEENARLCRKLGLDFVEINMNFPQYQADDIGKISQMKQIMDTYGIFYTIHLDENLNVCDFNKDVAKAYQKVVLDTIRAAKKLNIPVLNMHMHNGVQVTLPQRKVQMFEQYREAYLKNLILFRDCCESEIGESKLKISVENTGGYFPFQREGVEMLLESPVFSLTWDIGHSFVEGESDEPFLMEHQDRLQHFHVHDAYEKHDHLALGTGKLDVAQRLVTAARHHCTCVVETKTIEALTLSIKWLEDNGIKERRD